MPYSTTATDPQASRQAPLKVACPQCATEVVWSSDHLFRPFCSQRCQQLDLGAWADESHRIGGEPAMDETDIERMLEQADRDAPLS